MRDLLEERLEAVLLITIAALLAVVAFFLYSNGKKLGSIDKNQRALTEMVVGEAGGAEESGAGAQDATAKSLLRNGAISMEVYFADNQSFDGAFASLPNIEPTITWKKGSAASADKNEVAVTNAAQEYTLRTTSASGKTFEYARDPQGVTKRTCGPGCTW